MRLKEIIVESKLNELRQYQESEYGIGNVSGKDVATARNNFASNFKKQVKITTKKWLGLKDRNVDRQEAIRQLANSYMKKYGVSNDAITNPKTQELITRASQEDNLIFNPAMDALIDRMYLLASTTVQSQGNDQSNMQGTGRNTSVAAPSGRIAPTTKQIIKSIKKYTNEDDLDDLAKIAKTAMQVLYSQDPDSYTNLYNEITAGRVSPAAASRGAFNQMSNQLSGRQ